MNTAYTFSGVLIIILIGSFAMKAQPGNDCFDPIEIEDPVNNCSANAAFTTEGKTFSDYDPAICFSGESADVWFSFTAVATEVTIQVKGDVPVNPGGSLLSPEVQLYFGTCGDVLSSTQACGSAASGENIIEVSQSGLIPGREYFIRVQSASEQEGTFRLCVNNFNAPVDPGSDCATASLLCDKSSFTVQKVEGAGSDPSELDDALCFNNGNPGLNNESNSTWFKWTANRSGDLTFSLTPLNEVDDLDFVLYELPNGINDCGSKQVLRCMAAGEFIENYPSDCHGPTGLRPSADDNSEPAGCNQGQDNWLSPIQMESGKSYALAVNNFSGSGSGFEIDFGGSGTFQGPEPDFEFDRTHSSCFDEPIEIENTSSNSIGSIEKYEWFFGSGATPETGEGEGPFSVEYSTAGTKTVLLKISSSLGCVATVSKQLELVCCDPDIFVNAGEDTEVDLGDPINLSGEVFLPGEYLNVQWTPSENVVCPDCLMTTATPTQSGFYVLDVTDEDGCRVTDSLFVNVFLNYPAYIPNAFSPNADNINDFFTAYSNEAAANVDIQIYDRWGNLVFEARQIPPGVDELGWDGTFKGEKVNTGIYIYRVQIQYIDGRTRQFSGDLFLQR